MTSSVFQNAECNQLEHRLGCNTYTYGIHTIKVMVDFNFNDFSDTKNK